jgi:hypothetical protein
MAVRLSALRTGRTLISRNIVFLLLVFISVKGELQGLVWTEGLASPMVTDDISLRVKQPERESDHTPVTSAEV